MKILICLCVYNRKKISKIVAKNLYKYKKDADLWIYNDWSTEYENDYLEEYCDKIFKLPKSDIKVVKNEKNKNGMGIQHLRWYQFREFVKMDEYDAIYFTDSDALHDENYINVLKNSFSKYKLKDKKGNNIDLPVCLYNTIFHKDATVKDMKDVMLRKTAPGISQLFSKKQAIKIVENLESFKKLYKTDPTYGWDYYVTDFLKLPFITTKTSYVEHFGASENSLHTPKGEWDRDRAILPTTYLSDRRDDIINHIENKESDYENI